MFAASACNQLCQETGQQWLSRVSQMPDFLKSSPARSFSQPFGPKSYKNAKKIQKSYL